MKKDIINIVCIIAIIVYIVFQSILLLQGKTPTKPLVRSNETPKNTITELIKRRDNYGNLLRRETFRWDIKGEMIEWKEYDGNNNLLRIWTQSNNERKKVD